MSIWINKDSEWTARPPELSEPEEDWDILTIYPVVAASSIKAACAQFDKGDLLDDFGDMFVTDVRGAEIILGAGSFAMEVTAKGIANGKPAKWQIDSYAERNSYQSALTPAFGGFVPHDVSEPRLGVTCRYLSDAIPDTSLIGKNVTPDLALEPPANFWDLVTDPVFAWPWGWVLEKRGGPNIPGTNFYAVTDSFVYYQPYRLNS